MYSRAQLECSTQGEVGVPLWRGTGEAGETFRGCGTQDAREVNVLKGKRGLLWQPSGLGPALPLQGIRVRPWLLCFWSQGNGVKCLWLDCWSEEGGPAKRCTVYLVRNLGCVPSVGKIHQVLLDLERRGERMSWKRGRVPFEALVSLAVGVTGGLAQAGMRRGVAPSCAGRPADVANWRCWRCSPWRC